MARPGEQWSDDGERGGERRNGEEKKKEKGGR